MSDDKLISIFSTTPAPGSDPSASERDEREQPEPTPEHPRGVRKRSEHVGVTRP